MFPILGGRLLKLSLIQSFQFEQNLVSNPWREAIEEKRSDSVTSRELVSNPWREAIEAQRH